MGVGSFRFVFAFQELDGWFGSGSVPMFPVRFAVRGSVPEPH